MGEAIRQIGPTAHLGKQLGDAHPRHQRRDTGSQMLGCLGCRRLQRRDLQGRAGDADIGKEVPTGSRIDVAQSFIEHRSTLLQVDGGLASDSDR